MCERFIREERFKRAIGGDDSGNINLCKTIDLSSFDANSDLIKYDGMELDFEQLKNGNDENYGVQIKNMSQDFVSFMVNDLFLKGKRLPKKICHCYYIACRKITPSRTNFSRNFK